MIKICFLLKKFSSEFGKWPQGQEKKEVTKNEKKITEEFGVILTKSLNGNLNDIISLLFC